MIPLAYRELLRRPEVRRLVVVAMVARIPHSAAGLVLTYHVVETLRRSYTEAGAIVAVFTIGVGIGAPWRGRLVDRIGLRRALVPSIVAQAIVWPALGVAPYVAIYPIVFVAGLFALPIFSVVRKALSVMVVPAQRRTAFALDSVGTELIFMVGPAIGIWAANQIGAPTVLVAVGVASAASGLLLWRYDPPMTSVVASGAAETVVPAAYGPSAEAEAEAEVVTEPVAVAVAESPVDAGPPRRGWVTPGVVVILAVSVAAAVALAGTDVGVLAALRELDSVAVLGLAYSAWCASSAIGGLLYGAWHRSVSPVVLVLVLGLLTAPLVLAENVPSLIILLVVAGFACAPVMAATGDALSHQVPEERRGEAMGWQGTAFTLGSALGAPLAGVAIDRWGAAGGFGAVAVLAVVVAGAGGAVQLATRERTPVRYRRRPSGTMTACSTSIASPTRPTTASPTTPASPTSR